MYEGLYKYIWFDLICVYLAVAKSPDYVLLLLTQMALQLDRDHVMGGVSQ